MDARTLEALKGSIAKWEAIVEGTNEDKGVYNCPLCQVFFDEFDDEGEGCEGCPVKTKTGKPSCDDSPYVAWGGRAKATTDEDKQLAQAEVDFLRSLLPPEENSWRPISTAPKDREIEVRCPPREGLPELISKCLWHPDAGFCVDELREATHWREHQGDYKC
jgi:hypothetical protein